MKQSTEQGLAQNFLAHRDGYSLGYILRQSKRKYAIHSVAIMLFIWGTCVAEQLWLKGYCLWSVGMLFGALLRDVGWLRRIKRQWPFTHKIIDWKKVEGIAKNMETANKDGDQNLVP